VSSFGNVIAFAKFSGKGLDSLLVTLVRPFRRLRPNTIARHLKIVLGQAGVIDSAQSFRAASTSKVLIGSFDLTASQLG
jgi:hypothetical protein